MKASVRIGRIFTVIAVSCVVLSAVFLEVTTASCQAQGPCNCWRCRLGFHGSHCQNYTQGPGDICDLDSGGTWYWMRSPEQERRVVMSLYNRYCIRCHGVDGRGIWDIPDVPDFTNVRWQMSRPDAYRARIILEGRGAVMPPFRGTLTLEEACAMARYLHTFVPGSEPSRPDLGPSNPPAAPPTPISTNGPAPLPAPVSPPPNPSSPGPFSR